VLSLVFAICLFFWVVGLALETKFPMVLDVVHRLKLRSTILDCEIVALDKDDVPRVRLLKQWQKRPTAPVVYFLFDVLWTDGRKITGKTVVQRRERLEEIITPVERNPSRWLHRESRERSFQAAKD
jgi:bifunctional non-homologous end joining protein LigD